MKYSDFVIREIEKGKECSKINLSSEDILYQQYNVLKNHLFTPLFLNIFGFKQGIKIFDKESNREAGILGLELAPSFSIKNTSNEKYRVDNSFVHLTFLPYEDSNIVVFNRLLRFVSDLFRDKKFAFMWHKNGKLGEKYVHCNCEGGAVQHQHIVGFPKISITNLTKQLKNYDLGSAIVTAFGKIRAEQHPSYKTYKKGGVFTKKAVKKVDKPFQTLFDGKGRIIIKPAYCLGFKDGEQYFEKSIVINKEVMGESGFLRFVLTELYNNTSIYSYERFYKKIISIVNSDATSKEIVKNRLLELKYKLVTKLKSIDYLI